jgi:hypothetical protein
MPVGADHDVLEHRQVREEAEALQRAGDAEPGELAWVVPGQGLALKGKPA